MKTNEKMRSMRYTHEYLKAQSQRMDALVKAEEERLRARRNALERNQIRLCKAIKDAMNALDKTKIKTEKFTFSIVKNGGLQPLKIDAEKLPDKYKKVIMEPDNDRIREAIKAGEEIEGVEVLPRGEHLTIK